MNFLYSRRSESRQSRKTYLSLIWVPILVIITAVIAAVAVSIYHNEVGSAPLDNFDTMIVKDGFHTIQLENGKFFSISYEKNQDSVFTGTVRHTSMDHELVFPIISFDILVTTGDYSDRHKVMTNVVDHHFYWSSNSDVTPSGTINLLHTVPLNQSIEDQLVKIKVGDRVSIKGWEIYDIRAFSKKGNYISTWKDSGCNSLLVTKVIINP